MINFICEQCGVQFAAASEPPERCPICEDEREFVNWAGQRWTTLEGLRATHRAQSAVVLAGDFDAVPDAASIRFWSGSQALNGTSVCYRDAWESTHPTRSTPR